jgi:hypothetical protein
LETYKPPASPFKIPPVSLDPPQVPPRTREGVDQDLGDSQNLFSTTPSRLCYSGPYFQNIDSVSSLYPPSEYLNPNAKGSEKSIELNSYKFPKPRVYIKNQYPDTDKKTGRFTA